MNHFNVEFNDNCYELQFLRWFKDNFGSIEDVNYYIKQHQLQLMELINLLTMKIFIQIFTKIELGQYKVAYETNKNSVLSLEDYYAKPELSMRLVKCLKLKR